MGRRRSPRFFRIAAAVIIFTSVVSGWPPIYTGSPLQTPRAEAYTTTFTASGSWEAPAGVTSVVVEAWGSGGGGGGRGATNGASGGGGGGAYAKASVSVTAGNSYSYTIGAVGSGGASLIAGGDGGDTYWDAGAAVRAAGGKGGAATTNKGLGGATSDSVGTTKFNGGDGGNGSGSIGGGGGGAAGIASDGNDASGQTAGGYNGDGGKGNNGGSNANGTAGVIFGGGGGGAGKSSGTRLGAAGALGAIRITYSVTSSVSMQSGYYIGDSLTTHAISGLGFAPDLVLIKADTTAGAAAFKTRVMPEANMGFVTATADNTASNLILDTDGFTVGNQASVNSSGVRYTWIAFAGSDCSSSGKFCVGQYVGNGDTTRAVPTGFQPSALIIKRTSAVAAHFRTASEPDNEILYIINLVRDVTGNFIRTLDATGFTVGATDNAVSGVYNFIAFKSSADFFAEGTYAGNATDNTDITSVGFQPDAVIVKNATNVTAGNTSSVMNTIHSYGDYASVLSATASAVNYIQALLSNGFQIGSNVFVNGTGDTYYWMAFKGVPAATGASGEFEMATGTYTGNTTSVTIDGLDFAPDLVIIKDAGTNYQVFRTSLMKGDSTAYVSNAVANFASGITSLTSDGFIIGPSTVVNADSAIYHYVAFGNAWDPETRTGAADFAIGAYMGNGIDTRDIIGNPWQPDLVAIKRSGASAGAWRSTALSGDLSAFFSNLAEAANFIQAFNSDGFEIGTNGAINTAASLNYWFAFKTGDNMSVGSYTGNAANNRNITDPGFQPDLVWVKRSTTVNGVSRASTLVGDATQYFANLGNVSGRIQAFVSNGFQVGNPTETNANGGTYRFAAWRSPPPPNSAPTLSVAQPDGSGDSVDAGDAYDITYSLADADDVVTAAFYYDTNASGLDGVAISGACASAGEGSGATCSWDTTGITPGTYYIYGVTDDGTNPAVSSYSPGQITIQAAAPVYSVSISSSGVITYGFVGLGMSTTTLSSYTQAAENDGSAAEKLNIKSSDASGGTGWTLASSIGTDQFKHEFSTTTGSTWQNMPDSATYVTAHPSIAQGGSLDLDFRLTVPSASSDYLQKSITITVQAVAP